MSLQRHEPYTVNQIKNVVKVNAPLRHLTDRLLDRFIELGLHPEIGIDGWAIDEMPIERWREIARKFLDAGLKPTVHGPFWDLSPGAMDQRVLAITRERYERGLELARLFRPQHIVYHPLYDDQRNFNTREDWLRISLETWRPLARKARASGIHLVLENTHEGYPDQLLPLFEQLASEGVGWCFDIGHASAFGRAPIMEWLEVLSPYLSAMHLHDNNGQRDQHLGLGEGVIDFSSVFDWLVQHRIRPNAVVLEIHKERQLMPTLAAMAALWPWTLES